MFARFLLGLRLVFGLPRRLLPTLSVRARIAALALIPVVGFIANGLNYLVSEQAIGQAFDDVGRSNDLTDASRDLRGKLEAIRFVAKEMAVHPGPALVKSFGDHLGIAVKSLEEIQKNGDPEDTRTIPHILRTVSGLKENFASLAEAQELVGYTEKQGLNGQLNQAAAKVEQTIKASSWLPLVDAQKLSMSVLSMRRFEAQYKLRRENAARKDFFAEVDNFNKALDELLNPETSKIDLRNSIKAYAAMFREYVSQMNNVDSQLTLIDQDAQEMTPLADRIAGAAKRSEGKATTQLEASQQQTKVLVVGIGLAVVALGLILSYLIGRSITGPLNGLAAAMGQLAEGDTSVAIPATEINDEIGHMARTVLVFRDNAIERERLSGNEAETSRERERRSQTIAATIGGFERSVDQALAKLRGAAERLDTAAAALNGAADAVSAEARSAEERVAAASENVSAAAASAEELTGSIGSIAEQAAKSTEVAGRAVAEAQRTVSTMSDLGNAATRIGEVIGLIQAIAGQTNLLALNATIEAARAGEAGKGFAVVASEVKSLAGQTGKATEEIAAQIGAIQSAAGDAAQAIEQVNAIIEDMSGIATTVATAVEEQNAAVASIAEGVNRASSEARSGAQAMSRVAGRSQDARTTAGDVKSLAESLASEAESLDSEVRRFLAQVRAA
ncbi:MAG: methyl-accepting chemotaxis protein [Xanthobacteraceae bacterium]